MIEPAVLCRRAALMSTGVSNDYVEYKATAAHFLP